jgi:hypothetical protein
MRFEQDEAPTLAKLPDQHFELKHRRLPSCRISTSNSSTAVDSRCRRTTTCIWRRTKPTIRYPIAVLEVRSR